jgi:hypothetical protein
MRQVATASRRAVDVARSTIIPGAARLVLGRFRSEACSRDTTRSRPATSLALTPGSRLACVRHRRTGARADLGGAGDAMRRTRDGRGSSARRSIHVRKQSSAPSSPTAHSPTAVRPQVLSGRLACRRSRSPWCMSTFCPGRRTNSRTEPYARSGGCSSRGGRCPDGGSARGRVGLGSQRQIGSASWRHASPAVGPRPLHQTRLSLARAPQRFPTGPRSPGGPNE